MYPKAIEFYFAPKDVGEVLALLRQHHEHAKLLAGGQSLMPLMKLRLVEPRTVIDRGLIRFAVNGNTDVALHGCAFPARAAAWRSTAGTVVRMSCCRYSAEARTSV